MFRFIETLRLAAPLFAAGLLLSACDSADAPTLELTADELAAMSDDELTELAALELNGEIELVVVDDEIAPVVTGQEPIPCDPPPPGLEVVADVEQHTTTTPVAPLRIHAPVPVPKPERELEGDEGSSTPLPPLRIHTPVDGIEADDLVVRGPTSIDPHPLPLPIPPASQQNGGVSLPL